MTARGALIWAIVAAMGPAFAADLPHQADLTFHAPFDGSAEPAVARDPTQYYADELRYSHGVSNMAAAPHGRGGCRYPCEGHVAGEQGTLALWVCPIDWVGAEAGALELFTLDGDGRIGLAKSPAAGGRLVFAVRGAAGKDMRVDQDVSGWLPGRWRHLVATWSPAEIALYSNGRQVARQPNQAGPVAPGKHFYVGRTRWNRIGRTALDEVRLYRRALSPADVAGLHQAEATAYAKARRFPAGLERLPLAPATGDLAIQVGDSRVFRFQGIDTFRKPVCLDLWARIHRRACSQYYALDLWLNGQRMEPYLGNSRAFTRLMNKPFFFTYTAGGEGAWFGENWVVYYGLDWDDALAIKTASAVEPGELHHYVFDVTPLLRPDQTNTLEIRNCAYTVRHATHGSDCPLIVKDLTLRHFEPAEQKYTEALRLPPAGVVVPRDYSTTDYRAEMLPTGAIQVSCAGGKHLVESIYSYPGGIGNGFHSDARLKAEPQWEVRREGTALAVVGRGRFYRVERKVSRRGSYLAVVDRITNTGPDDLGMVIKNTVRLGPATQEVYLCGNRNVTFAGQLSADEEGDAENVTQEFEATFSSYNPTFFVKSGEGGLGIAVLDDVVRIQAKVFAQRKVGGVYTDRFALAPGKSYDLTWSIVPVAAGGYYEFINTLRAVEGLNVFECDSAAVGKWYMGRWEEPKLAKWLNDRKLKYLIVGPIVPGMDEKSRHGPVFMDHANVVVPEYRQLVEKVHKLRPGTKVLTYFATMHCLDEGDHKQRAQSCLRINSRGQPARYARDYFCAHVDGRDPYSAELRRYVDFCLDTIGFDGLFWDVMACARERDIDYSRWDGHSAILDESYRIRRKISIQGIEGIPFFVELIERIYAKDKVLIADYFSGAKTVLAALKKHRVLGTMEGNALGRNLVRTHLHTPLTMRGAEDPTDMDRCFQQIVQNVRSNLRHGSLYVFYGPWVDLRHSISTDHIYPITPVELHPGYIIGRRKMVTTRSGAYGWPRSQCSDIKVHLYNVRGEKVRHRLRAFEQGDLRMVKLDLACDDLAVLERVPIAP